MTFTPTYATADQLRDYTGKDEAALPDPEALLLLQKAEGDIDSVAVVGRPTLDSGRRFDPEQLDDVELNCLMLSTCAQAEYRLEMGASFFIRGQHEEVSGPEFSTKGKLGRIGPQTMRELSATQLVKMTTTTANRRGDFDPTWRRV